MRNIAPLFCTMIIFLLTGCAAIRQKSKLPLQEGVYIMKGDTVAKPHKVYITVQEDSVRAYPLILRHDEYRADSIHSTVLVFPLSMDKQPAKVQSFTQESFDVDVLTIAFKYRPYTQGFPNQFNTNLNGAVYLGYRADQYVISYDKSPLNHYQKSTAHYAYGFGVFAGLGSTALNEWVTVPPINIEYDGVVLTNGVAGIVGVGKLTFGLALGLDHLLDANHKVWIYQGKPWVGLTVGLNLN
jgi:hypothetical protein